MMESKAIVFIMNTSSWYLLNLAGY
jgi:hypothetical protein